MIKTVWLNHTVFSLFLSLRGKRGFLFHFSKGHKAENQFQYHKRCIKKHEHDGNRVQDPRHQSAPACFERPAEPVKNHGYSDAYRMRSYESRRNPRADCARSFRRGNNPCKVNDQIYLYSVPRIADASNSLLFFIFLSSLRLQHHRFVENVLCIPVVGIVCTERHFDLLHVFDTVFLKRTVAPRHGSEAHLSAAE